MQYVIVIEPAPDGGWGAYAPDLPGVVSLGDTPEESETEMRQALAFHLEGMREDRAAIPAPAARAIKVDVPAA